MWRNLVEQAGGMPVLGTPFVGLLGSDILATAGSGDAGASIFANDAITPTKRYRARIQTSAFPAGAFWLNEDGSGWYTAAGTATIELFEDNLAYGVSTLTGVFSAPAAPSISVQPASVTVVEGGTATFTVVATGAAPLTYQWMRGGLPVAGQTGTSFTIDAVTRDDTGAAVSVVVSNAEGSVTSAVATLYVSSAGDTVDYDAWNPFVLPEAPSCPSDVVIFQARQACIEFFERTHAWQEDLEPVPSVTGQTAYALPLPAGAAAVKLFAAKYGDDEATTLNADAGRLRRTYRDGMPTAWLINRTTAGIAPPPSADGVELLFTLSLKPTQASVGVPDLMFEHYAAYISYGVLSRVLAMKRQEWYDLAEAQRYAGMFEGAIQEVAAKVQRGFARSTNRTTPVWF